MQFVFVDPEKLYEKDNKIKREDVKILQEWLKKQPHLPELKELQIIVFLHSCYYRVELAKTTIDKYFTNRTLHPELFNALSKDNLKKVLSVAVITILPKKTLQGHAILATKLIDLRPENYNFCDLQNAINMVATMHMHQKGFERGGLVIFDCKGFSFSHLSRINLSALKHALEHLQEGAPVRIKGVHFINVGPVMDRVMSMIKPLLGPEVHKMLQLHPTFESLYNQIPKDCLPENYGGDLPSVEILNEENLNNLLENYDFFHWHDSQKVDEAKRLGVSKGSGFGVDGTFKKLAID